MIGTRLQSGPVLRFVATILIVVWMASIASAVENVVFTIDTASSSFSYSGSNSVYGDYVPQSPGSDVSSVTGHFLVSFDPTTDSPTSIQFIGNDGFYEQTTPLAMTTSTPGVAFNYSGLSWDFNSPVLTGSGGSFSAATTNFDVVAGTFNATYSNSTSTSSPVAPYADHVTAGTWQLTELGAGTGNWQLSISGSYSTTLGLQSPYGSGPETFALNATSSAHFGADNIAMVAPTDTSASVLGGASTPGGVSINLPGTTNGGTFTAQQIPNPSGLSQLAITAGENNPVFAASTGDLSVNPQIWTVEYTGLQAGQMATLVFHYDPTLLPPGTDESKLGMWHFNGSTWDFGGTVNTMDHTITFDTTSFSPFELGVSVPEPSTMVLAMMGLLALLAHRLRKRST